MANQHGRFQARSRMRVMDSMLPVLHQIHVIRAITRHHEIDKEGLYGQALADFTHGDNAEAFSALGEFVHRVTSGTLLDDKGDAPVRTLLSIYLRDVEEHTCSNIREFNHRYLNNKGISALLTLLAFDAAGLDLAAIDVLRGGEAFSGAYGPRKTRRHKNLGKQVQSWLKDLKSADEPATMEAADRYVEYRYLDHGNLPNYKKRKELEGDTRSERYYREWFRDFNKALGFWQPGPGRPSNTSDHH